MKNLRKKDVQYVLAMALFGVLCVIRYYNENIIIREVPFEIMNSRRGNQLITAVLFLVIIVFTALYLNGLAHEKKIVAYYLLALVAIFMMPTFICDSYMGSSDVYSWIIALACLVAVLYSKHEWIVIPGMFLMVYISPMMVFSAGAIIFVALINKAILEKKKINIIYAGSTIVMAIIALITVLRTYVFVVDVQPRITVQRFVMIVLMFSPYILWYCKLMIDFASSEKKEKNNSILSIINILAIIPGVILWTYMGDYCRAVIYLMLYMLLTIMVLYYVNDDYINLCILKLFTKIKEKVILSPVVVIYPLIILTYWMISNDFIDPEGLIELVK